MHNLAKVQLVLRTGPRVICKLISKKKQISIISSAIAYSERDFELALRLNPEQRGRLVRSDRDWGSEHVLAREMTIQTKKTYARGEGGFA